MRRTKEEGCYNDDNVDVDERDRSLRFEKGRLYFHGVCVCVCVCGSFSLVGRLVGWLVGWSHIMDVYKAIITL
jgi:hypothetical protein